MHKPFGDRALPGPAARWGTSAARILSFVSRAEPWLRPVSSS